MANCGAIGWQVLKLVRQLTSPFARSAGLKATLLRAAGTGFLFPSVHKAETSLELCKEQRGAKLLCILAWSFLPRKASNLKGNPHSGEREKADSWPCV